MYRICDRLSNRKKKMFFEPLVENIMSKLKNSKWRIQNGGKKNKKLKNLKKTKGTSSSPRTRR